MAVYQIVKEGDPVLREKAKPINKANDAAKRLLDNLRDTLFETDTGVGIAAPQIGVSKQAVVIATEDDYLEMINPQIIDQEGSEEGWEGCLSVPGVEGLVPRATRVTARYYDREGRLCEVKAQDFLARVIQHEVDHLSGVLFIDRAEQTNKG